MQKTTNQRHAVTHKPSGIMPTFATLEEGSEYAYYEAISKNVNPSSVMVSTEDGAVTGELFESSLGEASNQSNIALRTYPVSSPGADGWIQRSVSPEEAAEIVDETLENSAPPAAVVEEPKEENLIEAGGGQFPIVPVRTGSILRDAVNEQKAAAEEAVAKETSDLNPDASDEITPEEAIEQLAVAEDSEPVNSEPTELTEVDLLGLSLDVEPGPAGGSATVVDTETNPVGLNIDTEANPVGLQIDTRTDEEIEDEALESTEALIELGEIDAFDEGLDGD